MNKMNKMNKYFSICKSTGRRSQGQEHYFACHDDEDVPFQCGALQLSHETAVTFVLATSL